MRKNNPYYKEKGRPSETAIDWEFKENLREEFERTAGGFIETRNSVVYADGLAWDVKQKLYENVNLMTFSLDFPLILNDL